MKRIFKKLLYTLPVFFTGITVQNPAPGLFSTNKIFGGANPTVSSIIYGVINILLGLAGTIAILLIIVGGYQVLTARGDSTQAENGKKTLTNVIIGVAIIILSYTIVSLVYRTL